LGPPPHHHPTAGHRRPQALRAGGFYDFGVHDAQLLTHSPAANVRISDESAAIGLTADELRRLLATAAAPRSAALVSLLAFCGLRISEALGADVGDLGHGHGHRQRRQTGLGRPPPRPPSAPSTT
jgi:integrase